MEAMTQEQVRAFQPSSAEQKHANAWIKKHKREHRLKTEGAIGGRWQYAFIPTGIGTIVEVCCTVCGAKEDVTDYACW